MCVCVWGGGRLPERICVEAPRLPLLYNHLLRGRGAPPNLHPIPTAPPPLAQYPAVLWLLCLEDDLKTRVPWPAALLGHELGEEVSCVLPGHEGLLVTQLVHYGLRWDARGLA